jgi:hypothetical protein
VQQEDDLGPFALAFLGEHAPASRPFEFSRLSLLNEESHGEPWFVAEVATT